MASNAAVPKGAPAGEFPSQVVVQPVQPATTTVTPPPRPGAADKKPAVTGKGKGGLSVPKASDLTEEQKKYLKIGGLVAAAVAAILAANKWGPELHLPKFGKKETPETIADKLNKKAKNARDKVYGKAQDTKSDSESLFGKLKRTAKHGKDEVGEGLHYTKDAVGHKLGDIKHAAGDAKDKVVHAAHQTHDAASHQGHKVEDKASELAAAAKKKAEETAAEAKKQAAEAKKRADEVGHDVHKNLKEEGRKVNERAAHHHEGGLYTKERDGPSCTIM